MTEYTIPNHCQVCGDPESLCCCAKRKRMTVDELNRWIQSDEFMESTRPLLSSYQLMLEKALELEKTAVAPEGEALERKLILDTGHGCSICRQTPVVNVSGTYWLCGSCVDEKLHGPQKP